ncbi:MAG TPA: bacterial transcriptional activator domain-containing protein [Ktedonobacteraceae bacterium]|nr:bacterial transcriptional activator domain-containing protein [Ktedonobacteraceae bacterium]
MKTSTQGQAILRNLIAQPKRRETVDMLIGCLVASRREELRKTYVATCAKLAEFNLEHGCHKDAAKWASAILKVDHCDEEAHQQLMQAYAAEGCCSEMLRQYQRCQRVLQEELGFSRCRRRKGCSI